MRSDGESRRCARIVTWRKQIDPALRGPAPALPQVVPDQSADARKDGAGRAQARKVRR